MKCNRKSDKPKLQPQCRCPGWSPKALTQEGSTLCKQKRPTLGFYFVSPSSQTDPNLAEQPVTNQGRDRSWGWGGCITENVDPCVCSRCEVQIPWEGSSGEESWKLLMPHCPYTTLSCGPPGSPVNRWYKRQWPWPEGWITFLRRKTSTLGGILRWNKW